MRASIQPGEIYGDKAYFRKDILDSIAATGAEALIPVSACAYKIDEEAFRYNKDSDQWFCVMGNHTVRKERKTRKRHGKNVDFYEYCFDKEQCVTCKIRVQCMKSTAPKRKAKILGVSLQATDFYTISQSQKTPEFQKRYKKRAAHEWKNAEMKRFHGLACARGYGLRAVTIQAKLTAIAVNLKRIAALVMENAAILFSNSLNGLYIRLRFFLATQGSLKAA